MNVGRVALGTVLVGVGALVLAGGTGAVDAGELLRRGWPLLVIGLGVLQITSDRKPTPAGVGIVAVGLMLLAGTIGILGGAGRVVGPLIVVGLGVWVALGLRRRGEPIAVGDHAGNIAAFGSRRVVARSTAFRGGWAAAFLGQLDLDLTGVSPAAAGMQLSVTVVLGGADVVIPGGWAVHIRGLPIFGTWDDTTRHVPAGDGVPELRVNALAAFGGIEIKHRDRWS